MRSPFEEDALHFRVNSTPIQVCVFIDKKLKRLGLSSVYIDENWTHFVAALLTNPSITEVSYQSI